MDGRVEGDHRGRGGGEKCERPFDSCQAPHRLGRTAYRLSAIVTSKSNPALGLQALANLRARFLPKPYI